MEKDEGTDAWEYERSICDACIGEKYLKAEVRSGGNPLEHRGVENEAGIQWRRNLLRKIGYKF